MNEDLPSVNDFIKDTSTLPSVNDFIEKTPPPLSESVEADLPSYKEFLEEEVIQEEVVEQPAPITADLSSVITLIEGVRNSIPEVKSYDKELYDLVHQIEDLRKDIPEFKSYDQEIKEIKESIPSVPEVRYYDKEIQELRDSIPSVPEVKYYDQDIKELKESIHEVKDRYIPDFRWIIKTFSQLDEGQENLVSNLTEIKSKLEMEINDLVESIDVVKFEAGVDAKYIKSIDEKLTSSENTLIETIGETKEKIFKEIKDTSVKVWNLKKELQEDDSKLKKELGAQYKKLGKSLNEIIESQEQKDSKVNVYLRGLKEEIDNLPEVRYYDEQISEVSDSVKSVRNLVEVLENKLNRKIEGLKESILVVPPTEDNTDPLTPLDKNFATLDDLSNHYRLFLNRIQQQLSTLGGGGEVRLEFLDDIDRDSAKVNGKFLKYDSSLDKWVGATASGGGGGGGISVVGTAGSMIQHNGTEYVGVTSVGIATFMNDYHQGYYRYSTHYYSSGIANTIQTLPADTFVLIQPSVRSDKYDFLPEKMLIANSNDPWIGAGATIGTGQTEFSLAGLDPGSSVIVRIAAEFDPDIDNTNLDFGLNFTTNTETQGTGLTNFSIIREQGLICNEGADQPYISETLINFYVGSSLYGLTKQTAGSFNISARASDEGDLQMMALTINIVT